MVQPLNYNSDWCPRVQMELPSSFFIYTRKEKLGGHQRPMISHDKLYHHGDTAWAQYRRLENRVQFLGPLSWMEDIL
jgi:hypothetical protein